MRTTWPDGPLGTIEVMGSRFPSSPRVLLVHSVFNTSLNLQDKDDGLCALVMKAEQLHPCTAFMHSSTACTQFSLLGLARGQKVLLQEDRLSFDCGLWVSFVGSMRVHPNNEAAPAACSLNNGNLTHMGGMLTKAQHDKGAVLVYDAIIHHRDDNHSFIGCFSHHARVLLVGVQTRNLLTAERGMQKLLGFGAGSTPVGDDFLCGFLLALFMLARSAGEGSFTDFVEAFTTQLRRLLYDSSQRTTDISKRMLLLACDNLFSQALVAFAQTVCSDQLDEVQYAAALQVLSGLGHSSGYDAASGLLYGLLPEIMGKGGV
jgi:hypothetical protein